MYIIERCNICYCNDTLSVYHNLFRRDSKLDIPQKNDSFRNHRNFVKFSLVFKSTLNQTF